MQPNQYALIHDTKPGKTEFVKFHPDRFTGLLSNTDDLSEATIITTKQKEKIGDFFVKRAINEGFRDARFYPVKLAL